MRRLFKNSEVAKWKLQDYTAHKEGMLASKAAALARAAEQKALERAVQTPYPDPRRDDSICKFSWHHMDKQASNSNKPNSSLTPT
jgi:hypothetical protein